MGQESPLNPEALSFIMPSPTPADVTSSTDGHQLTSPVSLRDKDSLSVLCQSSDVGEPQLEDSVILQGISDTPKIEREDTSSECSSNAADVADCDYYDC